VSASFDFSEHMKSPKPGQSDSGFVLLGFAEALPSPEVAWSLVDAGFRVAAFSRKGRRSALRHSRHVTIFDITAPETNSTAALADLLAVLDKCRSASASVLFPLDDTALWLCCQIPLPAQWVLAGPSAAGAQFALNKSLQIKAAHSAGLPVPQTTVAQTKDQVLTRVGDLPLILKPANAVIPGVNRLNKGSNWICANRCELDHALTQWREEYPLLVQPYIVGAGVGVFGFADAGGVECWSAHRRLRMMNPHGSGSSACASRSVPENLKGPVERMILENGWSGLFMVELLQDDSAQYWFVEFNGRAWGSMALSRRQGLEYPAWNARLALVPAFSVRRSEPVGSEVVCRNLGRELMHLLFVVRGRKSRAIEKWPSFWRSVADVLWVRRRDRFYNFRRDDLRVFFSDCFCTIRDQIFKARNRERKA
jgi:predicted ATP-grasp superfamily ATP-dependent carboligase